MIFQSTSKERKSISLTAYQNGFGAVKEVRQLAIGEEITEVHFLDLARLIESESVLVKGLKELEQNYANGLMNINKLLEKYIGQVVTVRHQEFGEDMKIRLLGTADGIIGELVDTKEIVVNPLGQFIFPPLPSGEMAQPALILKVVPQTINGDVQLSYLTPGIGWQANYMAEIQGSALNLAGWVKLHNQTGTDFSDATIKLVAGQINRRSDRFGQSYGMKMLESSSDSPQFSGHGFADYHTYTLERKADLLDEQTKNIRFLEAQVVAFRKVYEVNNFDGRVRINVEFDNTAANGLGVPLPGGTVKIYEQDQDGELEFTGEDGIFHTAADEKISITIGEAFDISCESEEKKREKKAGHEYVTYNYDLRNRKEENVRIHICHSIYEPVWKMESSTHDYQIKNSGKVEFIIRAAAGKSVAVEFTYRIDRH